MEHKRKFSRLPFKSGASVTLSDDPEVIHVDLIDISLKGALVEFAPVRELPLETPVVLRLELVDSKIAIEMKTRVAHVNEGRIGLRCYSIDLESMTHLRRVMELNLGDSTVWEREVLQLG